MKKNKDTGKKISVIVISSILVFSMIISIFAVVVDNGSSGIPNYNKHSFIQTNNGYKTKINGTYKEFYNYPGDLERINMSADMVSKLRSMTGLGVVFDPYQNLTDNLAFIDVVRYDLQTELDKPVYFGLTNSSENYQSLPVVNCSIATKDFPIIIINTNVNYAMNNDILQVSKENPDCIIINAKLRDLLAAKDRIVYTYYGIME